jgi:hypothetical protein
VPGTFGRVEGWLGLEPAGFESVFYR